MENNADRLIEEYYQKKKSGWGFFEIRKELEGKNYPPETISAIIKSIYDTGYKGFIGQEFIPAKADKMASLEQAVKICDI